MQYKIQLDVYGGEFIVGSLSNKTINYWLTQEQESLDNHLVFDNQDKVLNPFSSWGKCPQLTLTLHKSFYSV